MELKYGSGKLQRFYMKAWDNMQTHVELMYYYIHSPTWHDSLNFQSKCVDALKLLFVSQASCNHLILG